MPEVESGPIAWVEWAAVGEEESKTQTFQKLVLGKTLVPVTAELKPGGHCSPNE